MSDYTPEPERIIRVLLHARRMAAEAHATSMALAEIDGAIEHAKACVNACAGIPTEQLGDVRALAEAAGAALQYIYLAYIQEGQAKRDELAGIAKRDFDALDAALDPFRKG